MASGGATNSYFPGRRPGVYCTAPLEWRYPWTPALRPGKCGGGVGAGRRIGWFGVANVVDGIWRRHKLVLPRAETRGLLHGATRVEVFVGPGSSAGEVWWWGGAVLESGVAPRWVGAVVQWRGAEMRSQVAAGAAESWRQVLTAGAVRTRAELSPIVGVSLSRIADVALVELALARYPEPGRPTCEPHPIPVP